MKTTTSFGESSRNNFFCWCWRRPVVFFIELEISDIFRIHMSMVSNANQHSINDFYSQFRQNLFAVVIILVSIVFKAPNFLLIQLFYLIFNVFIIFDAFEPKRTSYIIVNISCRVSKAIPKKYRIIQLSDVFEVIMADIRRIIILTAIMHPLNLLSEGTKETKSIENSSTIVSLLQDLETAELILCLFGMLLLGFFVKIMKIVVKAIPVSVSSLITHIIAFAKPISMDIKSRYTFNCLKIRDATNVINFLAVVVNDKQILFYQNQINIQQFLLFFVVLMDILHHLPILIILTHISEITSKQKESGIILTGYN